MKDQLELFLAAVDAALIPLAGGERLDLYHLGRSAIVWRFGLVAATKDVDVIGIQGEGRLLTEAVRLFGRGTPNAAAHALFLEVVPSAFPPVPPKYRDRAHPADGGWVVLRLFQLEEHDLIVTKLRRFSGRDQDDIRFLCENADIDPAVLEQRLESALWHIHPKDGDPLRDIPFANLRVVQKYLNEGVWG